jgi:hypothetical protein
MPMSHWIPINQYDDPLSSFEDDVPRAVNVFARFFVKCRCYEIELSKTKPMNESRHVSPCPVSINDTMRKHSLKRVTIKDKC